MTNDVQENCCRAEDVAAYLDGELSDAALRDFETHATDCVRCSAELRNQRQLLCTLDAAFGNSPRFNLPQNFTRIVAARAEGDLRGVRGKHERRRAFQMCVVIALIAFALLGAASGTLVFQPVSGSVRVLARVFDLGWQIIYDAAVGLGIILRMLGRAVVLRPYGSGSLIALAFLVAISALPRLIANYHRTQTIE
jgi:anti-sigma factor RsiW